MKWNWQLPQWPQFSYDRATASQQDKQFLLALGEGSAFLKTLKKEEFKQYIVEILSQEGSESSRIEGEILDRESLQSSIRRHFGLAPSVRRREKPKESGMAELLYDVYESYSQPLSHEMLWNWHSILFQGQNLQAEVGRYRTHVEPMQIVSNRYDKPKVFFEAPPSEKVHAEMSAFIKWFNASKATGSILGRAAIAHLYFESIHPFEDGNGRIGRVLVEKVLSEEVDRPILIAVSKVLERRKKEYYAALEKCNCTLKAREWVKFFSEAILEAETEARGLLKWLIGKARLFDSLSGKINVRQEKVLARILETGPEGFKGGLSAENYIAITKTSRATATRDLAELVELGVLTKTGELRHTRYWLQL